MSATTTSNRADDEACSILLIEDDPLDARIVLRALDRCPGDHYDVTHATTFAAAIDELERRSFDLILADLDLPDTEKLTIVENLHGLVPDTPIVILSGHQEPSTIMDRAIEAGAQDYLAKSELKSATLDRAIRYARQRKGSEAALREAKKRAEDALQAKALFLATMSHEIRTPMNGVLGTAELLLDSPLSDEQRELVNVLQHSGQALLTIINDILDYSKIGAGKMTIEVAPCELRSVCEESVATLEALADQKQIALTMTFDDRLPQWVSADATRVRQIVLNLVGNALKFTAQGQVTLRVSSLPRDDEAWSRIEVQDSGIGISKEDQARLFNRFTQVGGLESRTGGTGLGLAICHQLTQLMGGTMGVESTLGEGSTFWVELPIAAAVGPEHVARVSVPPPSTPARVLVVDDNPVNRMVAKRMLEKLGCTVSLAEDGREALRMAHEQQPDVIFMDCHMPVLDGFEATRLLRQQPDIASIPVVALTASAMDSERRACYAAGMDDFVAKPITRAALKAVLQNRVWPAIAAAS